MIDFISQGLQFKNSDIFTLDSPPVGRLPTWIHSCRGGDILSVCPMHVRSNRNNVHLLLYF